MEPVSLIEAGVGGETFMTSYLATLHDRFTGTSRTYDFVVVFDGGNNVFPDAAAFATVVSKWSDAFGQLTGEDDWKFIRRCEGQLDSSRLIDTYIVFPLDPDVLDPDVLYTISLKMLFWHAHCTGLNKPGWETRERWLGSVAGKKICVAFRHTTTPPICGL